MFYADALCLFYLPNEINAIYCYRNRLAFNPNSVKFTICICFVSVIFKWRFLEFLSVTLANGFHQYILLTSAMNFFLFIGVYQLQELFSFNFLYFWENDILSCTKFFPKAVQRSLEMLDRVFIFSSVVTFTTYIHVFH